MARTVFVILILFLFVPCFAAPPAEVGTITIDGSSNLSWNAVAGADNYHVYRGLGSELANVPPRCHGYRIPNTNFDSPENPPVGEVFIYLVTANSDVEGEGTPGQESGGSERLVLGQCEPVMRSIVLDRIGYGWSEWARDRIDAIGLEAYITEQIDYETIDESTNSLYNDRVNYWTAGLRPEDHPELAYLRYDKQLYARRQLHRNLVEFWSNHFTTNFFKTQNYIVANNGADFTGATRSSADVHLYEEEIFEGHVLDTTFRDILEASALSSSMMIYLDNVSNVVGRPNENYVRELFELHSQGVDKGYTEQDIREGARIFTGWEVCNKSVNQRDDPLAPCVNPLFGGVWSPNFRVENHDHGEKIIYAGTPYETIIPDTSANQALGVDDVQILLDAIVARPEPAEFIAFKLLRRFIQDEPTQAQIDAVVSVWNSTGGDLREVTRAVLSPENLLNPDIATKKIKTPQEHIYSGYRAMRGITDYTNPFFPGYLNMYAWHSRMVHQPYLRNDPDGFPDKAKPWLGTGQFLDRQDWGMSAAIDPFGYNTNVDALVADYGLSTAEEIVDFFAEVLFGGAWTPTDRQIALDHLETDENGVPSPYDAARIRETVGLMIGFAQFMER